MSNGVADKPFVPGLPEGRLDPGGTGRAGTIPMPIVLVAVTLFGIWAFDSLRWWIAVPGVPVTLAIALSVSIYFDNRPIRRQEIDVPDRDSNHVAKISSGRPETQEEDQR